MRELRRWLHPKEEDILGYGLFGCLPPSLNATF
jgi:hypothetical protein